MPTTPPPTLNVALKEWATVCRALATGRQILLLRKGGISESIGGFELEHNQFLLFPTYLHQNLESLKPEAHADFQPHTAEPDQIEISLAATVTNILQLQSRQQMDDLDDQHIWLPPLIDMRFNYRPRNPLYLMILRTYRLASPVTIQNTPAYAGCKSWVPLDHPVPTTGATPVLDDTTFQTHRQLIRARLEGTSTGFG
jgi:hypothetical protein